MKRGRQVLFDAVQVREYPICPTVNPASGRYQPAVGLGWDYIAAPEIVSLVKPQEDEHLSNDGRYALDVYERLRPSPKRRTLKSLFLYGNQRRWRLQREGFSDAQIDAAIAEQAIIARSRESRWHSPAFALQQNVKHAQRTRKVQRAVRNLHKTKPPSCIYSGWWIPLSAHFC